MLDKMTVDKINEMVFEEIGSPSTWTGLSAKCIEEIRQILSNKHSLPDIFKIQGDANILLDGINSIELFDDESRYDGKTIYRGKYKRGEERDIIAKYTAAQRNKHSDDRDPDDIVRECEMRIEEAYKRKEQIMAEACGITTKTSDHFREVTEKVDLPTER